MVGFRNRVNEIVKFEIDRYPARWEWWPVRLRPWFSRKSPLGWNYDWFRRHGICRYAIENGQSIMVCAQVWHLGPVKVILGKV
jgi:hypothetical protein